MSEWLLEPLPNEDAAAWLRSKGVLSREAFDQMLPELRARAFTITGIEDHDVLARVRDRIANLPEGADWDEVKQDIARDMTPWFVDADADPEEQARQMRRVNNRAELLLRIHGGQAYGRGKWLELTKNADVFPYWQYRDYGDSRVRETHHALNGLTLAHDDPFWADHFPPWEWLCRCMVVGITARDAEKIRAQDAEKNPDQRRILEGAALDQLRNGKLVRGPDEIYDVRSPRQRLDPGDPGAYRWDPSESFMRLDEIVDRYDPETRKAFFAWAKSTRVTWHDGGEQTVWQWLSGNAPSYPPAVVAGGDVRKALAEIGLTPDADAWTPQACAELARRLRKSRGAAKVNDYVTEVSGDTGGVFDMRLVHASLGEYFAMLPAAKLRGAAKFKVVVDAADAGKVLGSYSSRGRELRIHARTFAGSGNIAADVRETIFHELTHWVHIDGGPAFSRWRRELAALYKARTVGELPKRHADGYRYHEDDWWTEYVGRIYPGEAAGLELPTMHADLLAKPDLMAFVANKKRSAREVIILSLGAFF